MKGRDFTSEKYRYGFNGQEKDDEAKGRGNSYDYGARIYDNRLGRFLTVDPLSMNFSFKSPYCYAENDVIRCIDLEGAEKFEKTGDNKMLVTIVFGVTTKPNETLLGKTFKPVTNTLDFTEVEKKLKEVYQSGTVKIPVKLAKKLGFEIPEGTDPKKGKVEIQVEFKVSIKDVGNGDGFISNDKPENFSLIVKGAVKGAPAEQKADRSGDLNITVLNEKVFTEGKTDDELTKQATDYYNNLRKTKRDNITKATPGGIIGHEGGHKLFGEGNDGHNQGGVLDVEDEYIKTNEDNLQGMFDLNTDKMIQQMSKPEEQPKKK